ncbi:hypothetical protein [Flavobacterium sp.]|jgi:hypothetical protein|uniref:hypothetical protein n=1 Tax=Flavobacterium sp. TaxID=239 RepID=UPI0037BF4AC7
MKYNKFETVYNKVNADIRKYGTCKEVYEQFMYYVELHAKKVDPDFSQAKFDKFYGDYMWNAIQEDLKHWDEQTLTTKQFLESVYFNLNLGNQNY